MVEPSKGVYTPPSGNIDTNVIVALIGALAAIITAYFGYRAAKKK